MDHDAPPLIDRLRIAADAWSSATDRTVGALSAIVTNHGSFFDRLGSTRAGVSTTTLEKFARFFADPANWPDGAVSPAASEFVHVVIGSTSDAGPASGLADELSGKQERAA